MYYKIIKDGVVIDAVMGSPWVCKGKHGRPVRCDPRHATGVLSSDSTLIYHIDGAAPLGDHPDVIITDISQEEYERLLPQLELNETIPDMPDAPEVEPESPTSHAEETSVMSPSQMRQHILKQDRQIADLTQTVSKLLKSMKEVDENAENS